MPALVGNFVILCQRAVLEYVKHSNVSKRGKIAK
jgi:hypothetical protein